MEERSPVRKKWSERQFELFADAAREIGRTASREDFENLLDQLLSAGEPRRKGRKPTSPKNGGRR